MSTKQPDFELPTSARCTLRLPVFTDADLHWMQLAMAEMAPEWSVELQGICVEEAVLVLLPDGGDDAHGASFVISRETYGFRLDQVHWDTMSEVGIYISLTAVLDAVRPLVAFCTASAVPAGVTVH